MDDDSTVPLFKYCATVLAIKIQDVFRANDNSFTNYGRLLACLLRELCNHKLVVCDT